LREIPRRGAIIAALGLLVPWLALAAGTATAAVASTAPGHSIATAGTLAIGGTTTGGGGPIDFWKVKLSGGDQVFFTPDLPASYSFTFALYTTASNDTNFNNAVPFAEGDVPASSTTKFDLQAPYNGTFILAVCESVPGPGCRGVESGYGNNPMSTYSFTTVLVNGGIPAATAARETKAAQTIAAAPKLPLGHFEAGGGGLADFWKLPLNAGDTVQFKVTPQPTEGGYTFALYPQGTNDTNFLNATSVASGDAAYTPSTFQLKAPKAGTYVLAVCQNVSSGTTCTGIDRGAGSPAMPAYTFATSQVGGLESKTSLKLSAATASYGHEKALKFSVAVAGVYGKKATGKVEISNGKKTVCVVKLTSGKGACSPASNTALAVGKYEITAYYAGNLIASKSGTGSLTVKK
jgi:hypothetical protein